jgi:hypothetical protein
MEIQMGPQSLTDEDLRQITHHGMRVNMVKKQLGLFKKPPPYLELLAPCTPDDGIRLINPKEIQDLTKTYELEVQKGRCLKFIPASGAASRMFRALQKFLNRDEEILRDVISANAQAGEPEAHELFEFVNGIKRFAFFKDLRSIMSANGFNLDALLKKGRFTEIIRFLLMDMGLNYSQLPKGLLKFHQYPDESRTAFEEHLVEAIHYLADAHKRCLVHFTVSEEHLQDFQELLERLRPIYEKKYSVSFQVGFSFQKKSTDTIAVDLANRPFREKNGRLLFRPGGHGSLIENLNDLKGDILFIKNVDNVAFDRLGAPATLWKKILGGYLVHMQNQIFGYEQKLSSGEVTRAFLENVADFMRKELLLSVPYFTSKDASEKMRAMLLEKLHRPLRVCGMVRNVGEPGGGPFWVKSRNGERTLQIVEKAQVDPDSEEQQAILGASTHFNSVDLVCGVRDRQGRPFDLRHYVDSDAVFISKKSKDGRDLKALEHPGLWNGAMARWITLFVEVPGVTFNPVKTVNDLLREAHQP